MKSFLSKYTNKAIFGAFDGIICVLGIIFSLVHSPNLIFMAGLGVAVAEGIGMASGEWLSDSDNGFGASIAIGTATALGSLVPVLPFLFVGGTVALAISFGILILINMGITYLRMSERGLKRAIIETYGVMTIAALAVFVTQILFGSS